MKTKGTIAAAHGRQYLVELEDGGRIRCFPRGKRSEVACGDRVIVERSGHEQGVIEAVEERSTLLYRSNEFRQKLIAANVSQIIIVVATEPSFSDELVSRCIAAAESQDMKTVIILNKCDLANRREQAEITLQQFERIGYPVLKACAKDSVSAIVPYIKGETSVLVGQSGMGKSTLINALIPSAMSPTREISEALDSGKHTTTHATLYRHDAESFVIDSPGLQEFGLQHLSLDAIAQGFVELRPMLGQCRFRNCRHDREPGCAVHTAVEKGEISARRYAAFRSLCTDKH